MTEEEEVKYDEYGLATVHNDGKFYLIFNDEVVDEFGSEEELASAHDVVISKIKLPSSANGVVEKPPGYTPPKNIDDYQAKKKEISAMLLDSSSPPDLLKVARRYFIELGVWKTNYDLEITELERVKKELQASIDIDEIYVKPRKTISGL